MTRKSCRTKIFLDVNVPFLFALKSSCNVFFVGRVCDFNGSIYDISKSTYITKPQLNYEL